MALDIKLREIASKAAGTYFIVTDNSGVEEILPTSNLRLVFINSNKGPVNTVVVFKRGAINSFQVIFGKGSRQQQKRGNYSNKSVSEMLISGPVAVINLRSFDSALDKSGIIGLNPNKKASETKTVSYDKLFNTNGLWTARAKNIRDILTQQHLLNIGNIGTGDVSFFITVSKNVSELTAESKESLRNTTLAIDDYPALDVDMILEDSFVDVYIFNNTFTNAASNKYYGHLFDNQDAIQSINIEDLAVITESGFNRRITGSLIPGLKNEFDVDISIDVLMNSVFPETGLVAYINDDILEVDMVDNVPVINTNILGYYTSEGLLTNGATELKMLSHILTPQPIVKSIDLDLVTDGDVTSKSDDFIVKVEGDIFGENTPYGNKVLSVFENGIRIGDEIIFTDKDDFSQKRVEVLSMEIIEENVPTNDTVLNSLVKAVLTIDAPVSDTEVDLDWSAVPNATSYEISRKELGATTWNVIGTVTGLTFNDSTIQLAKTYVYLVTAKAAGFVESYSVPVKFITAVQVVPALVPGVIDATQNKSEKTVLAKTTLTIAKQTELDEVELVWTSVIGATEYAVLRKESLETVSEYVELTTINTPATFNFLDTSIARDKVYDYVIVASTQDSEVVPSYSDAVEYTTALTGDVDDTNLVAGIVDTDENVPASTALNKTIVTIPTPNNTDDVTLSWLQLADVTGYNIYRKELGGVYSLLTTLGNPATLTHTDSTIEKGKTYFYIVEGIAIQGKYSTYSNAIKFIASLAIVPLVDGVDYPQDAKPDLPTVLEGTKTYTIAELTLSFGVNSDSYSRKNSLVKDTGLKLFATSLVSYKPREAQFTDGTAAKQKEILDVMISPGIIKGLKNFDGIRYLVDGFKTFVEAGYKYQFGQLCLELDKGNKFVRAIINEPFIEDLEKSTNPLFKASPTDIFEIKYLETGGNKDYSTRFLSKFTEGAEMCFFYGAGKTEGTELMVQAPGVSALFINKAFPFDVVANATGYLTGIEGIELNPDDEERVSFERFRWNPIIKKPSGFTIFGNNTGQKRKTALLQIQNSELLCYIKETLFNMSRDESFKKGLYNEYLATEIEIQSFFDSLVLNQAIQPNPVVICNASNNTEEVSSQGIKLIHIEYFNVNSLDKIVFDLNLN